MNISQKKLSHVWLISPWLPKPVLRARLKHVLKSIKKEDEALKREGLENLQEEQLKAVSIIKKHCHCSPCCERHFSLCVYEKLLGLWKLWLFKNLEKEKNDGSFVKGHTMLNVYSKCGCNPYLHIKFWSTILIFWPCDRWSV